MSSIFGIFNRSGDPVDQDIGRRMLDVASRWKPDESGMFAEGPAMLGHAMLWNTPESKLEQLPRRKEQMVITMDGRLDNREELAQKLGIERADISTTTDSELVMSSYQKWGDQSPNHLLGDFAFAIWNRNKRKLFCARDHMGIRPLYFSASSDCFVLGSDIEALLCHPRVSRKINDEAVANFLINDGLFSTTQTYFTDIEKIPPGHSITVSAAGLEKQCYWRPEDAPRVHYTDEREYGHHLHELLEQAVHCRVRSFYPVSSHLSGGLDSSSIAVIAARILRQEGKQLLAFNWLHEPSTTDDPSHYEWFNSKAVAERESIDHHYVDLDEEKILKLIKQRTIAYGNSATFWYESPVREAASLHGSRTLLSGWGGDELASYHGQAFYADLLMHGKITRLLRALADASLLEPERRLRRLLGIIYHRLFMVLVPRHLYCHLPRSHGCEKPSLAYVSSSFRPFVEEFQKKPTILTMQPQRTIRSHMLAYLQNGHIQDRIESWATAAWPYRMEYVYPLLDTRIVEFVLGVPGNCFIGNGHGRNLFRSALKGLLPDDIIRSSNKHELNRVKRLIGMEYHCFRKLGLEMNPATTCSKYIDVYKLLKDTKELDIPQDFERAVYLATEMDKAFAVLFSDELGEGRVNNV